MFPDLDCALQGDHTVSAKERWSRLSPGWGWGQDACPLQATRVDAQPGTGLESGGRGCLGEGR